MRTQGAVTYFFPPSGPPLNGERFSMGLLAKCMCESVPRIAMTPAGI